VGSENRLLRVACLIKANVPHHVTCVPEIDEHETTFRHDQDNPEAESSVNWIVARGRHQHEGMAPENPPPPASCALVTTALSTKRRWYVCRTFAVRLFGKPTF
jgi:hypothetical protein